jgi:hypothetical protein
LHAIIGDDGIRNPEAVDDIREEWMISMKNSTTFSDLILEMGL